MIRVLVVLGVGMIMGDGVLTPAISVVSACEGLQQASAAVTRSARPFHPPSRIPVRAGARHRCRVRLRGPAAGQRGRHPQCAPSLPPLASLCVLAPAISVVSACEGLQQASAAVTRSTFYSNPRKQP